MHTIEYLEKKDMEHIQLMRLKQTVQRVYDHVPYYRGLMEQAQVTPEAIKHLSDIAKLPFSNKEDLRINYPFGLFAVAKDQIVRLHASSGTTGKPTVVGYTQHDLDMWSEAVKRLAVMAGATQEDVVQIAFGYGLFTGAFGLHYGLEKLGATIIPISSGNTKKQLMMMQDLGTTILVSTPSYALHMGEVAKNMGIDPKKDLQLRIGLFGGEGSSESVRKELEDVWGILATENYGMSELIGPGVSGECVHKMGMHINEDYFLAEIIDPVTQEVLEDGQIGELVITTLDKEALPLIRYRTKDLTRLIKEPCACGRTTKRMEKISGRSDDMLIIRGVNVFPTQIEEVMGEFDELAPHYEILLRKEGHLDTLEIKIELKTDMNLDSYQYLQNLEKEIKHRLRTMLNLQAIVSLVSPKTLQRFEGKAKRIKDLRKIQEENHETNYVRQ
ncbi:phenylacetate--CoA ligase [Vallitaleaceae bacterium 9-2]